MIQPKPYVITIVGPESSGKTTLARELADRYGCPWVPEFAREYLDSLGRDYQEEDLVLIAKGQIDSIDQKMATISPLKMNFIPDLESNTLHSIVFQSHAELKERNQLKGKSLLPFYREPYGDAPRPMLIVDGGMLTIRVWAMIKFGMSIPIVEEALATDVTSMYILCRPVYKWEPDPLREAPSLLNRAWIYNQYLKELVTIPVM